MFFILKVSELNNNINVSEISDFFMNAMKVINVNVIIINVNVILNADVTII